MAARDDETNGTLNAGRMAAAAMVAGGGLLTLAATIWVLVGLYSLGAGRVHVPQGGYSWAVLSVVLVAVAGWGLGLLLWGGGEILRRLADLHELVRAGQTGAAPGPVPMPRPRVEAGSEATARLLEQLVLGVRDLRDITLLGEAERLQRAHAEAAALARQLEREVPALLLEHNWQEALVRVQRARQRFPGRTEWEAFGEQIEQARAKFENHDVEAAAREIEALASMGAWDRAADVVHELRRRHPNSERAAELARRVAGGLDKTSAEERARMMSRAQEATNQRNWIEALSWVEQVLERFPRASEAPDLRQQLPTLRANAEIQTRQLLEGEIRDLIKGNRFAEALERARVLIDRYPDSPQAAVLRPQLPRLEQRAAGR